MLRHEEQASYLTFSLITRVRRDPVNSVRVFWRLLLREWYALAIVVGCIMPEKHNFRLRVSRMFTGNIHFLLLAFCKEILHLETCCDSVFRHEIT